MPVDLSHIKLANEHPIYNQLARDWTFATAETAPLPQVESWPATGHEVRSHRAPGLRHHLTVWFLALNPVDILIFGVMASAYTAIVLGLVLAGRR
jgi:hypothetical protein